MKSRKTCDELAPLLKDLKITLNKSVVVLKPMAYLYAFTGERDCLIAIESGDDNEYRLGTLFLRHLYLGLDFEHNAIVLGQNPHAQDIYFVNSARHHDPYHTAPPILQLFVIFLVIGLTILGIFCAIRWRKLDEHKKSVIFGK